MAELQQNDRDQEAVPGAFLARVVEEAAMNRPGALVANDDGAGGAGGMNRPVHRPGAHVANDDGAGGAGADGDQNEEDAGEEVPQVMPTNQTDPRRMLLSEEERGWAIAIKQAIEADPDLESLSDFAYAQIALKDKDNLEAAIERAQNLQLFRNEYDMTTEPDLESSFGIMREMILLFPGFVLAAEFSEEKGGYVLVLDASKLFLTKERMQTFIRGFYFILHVCNPDFESVRGGMYTLTEYEGFSFKKNFSFSIYRTFWVDLTSVYPLRIVSLRNFNTGLFGNLIVSMGRSFLPSEIYSKFHLGCVCELGRLDTVLQAQCANILPGAREALKMRYANEASFKL